MIGSVIGIWGPLCERYGIRLGAGDAVLKAVRGRALAWEARLPILETWCKVAGRDTVGASYDAPKRVEAIMASPSLRLVLQADEQLVIVFSMDARALTRSGWWNVLVGIKFPQMKYVSNRVSNFYSMATFDGKESLLGLLGHCEVCVGGRGLV